MGKVVAVEKRARAERLYVVEGVVELKKLSELTGHTRNTLKGWCEKFEWEKKRSDFTAQPEELTDRLKKLLHMLLDEMDEMLKNKQLLALKPKVQDLERVIRSLHRIDAMFFSRGMMLRFLELFTEFVGRKPEEGEALKMLRRLAPEFIDHVEKELP